MRLNLGCGYQVVEGWVNVDPDTTLPRSSTDPVVVLDDVLKGLSFDAESFEEVYLGHVLHQFTYPEVRQALLEIRRVLHPSGELRIAEFDPITAFNAWVNDNIGYFPFDAALEPTIDGQLCRMLTYHSTRKSLWTQKSLWVQLEDCGFNQIWLSEYGRHPLDQRPNESFFMVAA